MGEKHLLDHYKKVLSKSKLIKKRTHQPTVLLLCAHMGMHTLRASRWKCVFQLIWHINLRSEFILHNRDIGDKTRPIHHHRKLNLRAEYQEKVS